MPIELPGLFDLQVNGFGGIDFNGPTSPPIACARRWSRMRATGVTRCLPTLITSSFDAFAGERPRPCRASTVPRSPGSTWRVRTSRRRTGRAAPILAQHVAPASLDDFKRRQDAADGRIVLVTLAPEVPGATARSSNIWSPPACASPSVTRPPTPQQIRDAIAAGATLATHLGNGCAQIAAAPSERHLGTAGGRRALRERHRRRPSPAAGDRQVA